MQEDFERKMDRHRTVAPVVCATLGGKLLICTRPYLPKLVIAFEYVYPRTASVPSDREHSLQSSLTLLCSYTTSVDACVGVGLSVELKYETIKELRPTPKSIVRESCNGSKCGAVRHTCMPGCPEVNYR